MADEKTKHRAIAELSPEVRLLTEACGRLGPDQEMSYALIAELIGIHPQTVRGRHVLQSARRRALREYGVVLATIRNVGVKRLTDAGIVASTEGAVDHVRRACRKSIQTLAAAEYERLNADQKTLYNARMTTFAVQLMIAKRRTQERLLAATEDAQRQLPQVKALEEVCAFLRGKKTGEHRDE